jgi:hypothetical protein
MLRVARMAKIARMARMVRLVRIFPELIVLLKGITAAVRSVMTFFTLWLIVIYIYAVVFKQLSLEQDIGRRYFETIPIGMNTLMIRGIFPDFAEILDDAAREYPVIWPVLLSFILLATITMTNMLIGVLVGVIGVLGAVEKETALVRHVASSLRNGMAQLNKDTSQPLTLMDFRQLLVLPEINSVVTGAGVDIIVLLEQSDIIFEALSQDEHSDEDVEMSFEKFIDTILNMRTTNPVTVKDMGQHARLMHRMIKEATQQTEDSLSAEFRKCMTIMRADLGCVMESVQHASEDDPVFESCISSS